MLGKLSSLVSYWKVLEVYTLKRFPSNKLPLFGMVSTYLLIAYMFHSTIRDARLEQLRTKRTLSQEKKIKDNQWSFNFN